MAAAYRSSVSTNTGSTPASSLTISLPAGVQVNDILIAAIAVDGGSGVTISTPADWTAFSGAGGASQGTNIQIKTFYRIANGQEAVSYIFSINATKQISGLIAAYSGGYPFFVGPNSTTNGTPGTSLSPPARNSNYETGLEILITAARNTTAASTINPVSGTEREDTCTTGSPYINLEILERVKGLGMGGFDGTAVTVSQSSVYASVCFMIDDLRPTFNFIGIDEYAVGSGTTPGVNNMRTNYPNEVVLAFITGNTNTTVSSITGTGFTWVLVGRSNTANGFVEVWRTFIPIPNTDFSVTVNVNNPQTTLSNILVVGFVGADITGTNGLGAIGAVATASSINAAPTVNLTTTRNNSLVFAAFNDSNGNAGAVAGSNQILLRSGSGTSWSTGYNRQNALTPTSGTVVTSNFTSPSADSCNIIAVEILPAIRGSLGIVGVG